TTDLQIGNLDLTWLVMHGCVTLPPPADADEISDVIVPGCYMLPTTWTYNSNGVHNTEYYRLGTCKSYADMVIGGTQDNGTYLYKDGAWINTLGGDGMEAMIHHDSVNIIWATNYNGALSRSNDGGQSYVSGLEAPITDAGELGDWVTPFVMHPVFADTIYAGFYNVWRSGDRGNTWEKLGDISNSQSLRALAVAPSNSNYIYAARPGGLLVTKNAGVSWEGISLGLPTSTNKITYIAVDAQNPEKVYVCFSGYSNGKKVYMSQNAGEDWINISSNLPNVSANSIVCENIGYQGAIYVGTDIGVYYSNDSIRASDSLNYWISYSEGLPNVVINELEINEAGQKLRAATYGRGLWETDLYVYENAVPEVEDISGIFKVFPNPNNGAFRITGKMIDSEDIKIRVFGLNGSLLFSYAERTNNVDKEIDLSKFANGTYILQIEMNNSHYTSKIVKE
ncbi:MAG: T9SS type A sorting domain-containing protein, partial [Bacteroidales bacterium]|nr:T9SS type A sorting domain-containing protein [Bacteroidales bacterium]